MDTPICDFVESYAKSDPLRFHMPGHKGIAFTGAEQVDITEISGADVLYHADGIIKQSEINAASLFKSAKTVYSAEGSSLCIRAMLYLLKLYCRKSAKKPLIAAGRNAHKTFINSAALLGIGVEWIYPKASDTVISCEITAELLDAFLAECAELPVAVYITSPDYLGNVADVRSLSEVCRRYGVLLLVDNAHGAYLQFLPESRHPMSLGADICCDSAHKTLPVLTGGAYLHISHHAPQIFFEAAERAMALFASTSPSYLILQSLDMANRLLSLDYPERLNSAVEMWDDVKQELLQMGFCLAGNEPLKLTIMPKSYGYTGQDFAELLERDNIFCEFSDPDFVVLMLSPYFEKQTAERLVSALHSVKRRTAIAQTPPEPTRLELAVSPHRALFMDCVNIRTSDSVGKIMASACVSCPPAIPVVSIGERIDEKAVHAMLYYGIDRVDVIAEM